MMELTRLAGAILAASEGQFFLLGNTKEPCDWAEAGFAAPAEIDATARPVQRLHPVGPVRQEGLRLRVDGAGEEVASRLAERLLIRRNGSVSERLWNLVGRGGPEGPPREGVVDATWLDRMPAEVWDIVRDTVLRCS